MDCKSRMERAAKIGPLVFILVFFSLLAFRGVNRQSLLYHDAGVYLLETKFLDEGFRLLGSLHHGGGAEFWEKIKTQTEGVPLHTGKPGLNFIFWIASLFTGLGDSLSAKVTAASGVLGLLLVFWIGRKISSASSAIYSMAFLASSVFYLVYSRSGVAEQVVTVFFLLGILFYLSEREKPSTIKLFLAGLSLGYASTCNPWRVLYMPVLLIGLDFLRALLERRWSVTEWFKRFALILFGFGVPLVAFELPYLALRLMFKTLPFPDYWSHLAEKLTWIMASGGMNWFSHMGGLTHEYWMVEGPFFVAAVLGAWIFLLARFLRKRNFQDLFLWAFSFIPFAYFSFSAPGGETLPRVVSNLIPLFALAVGEFMFWVHQGIKKQFKFSESSQAWILISVICLLLIQGFPRQVNTGITRSGYAEASRFLRSTGEKNFMILGMEPVWRFYLGRVEEDPYHRPVTTEEMIQKARTEQIKYVLVDYSTIHSKHGADFTVSFLGKVTPVASFDNPLAGAFTYLLDQNGLEGAVRISRDPKSRKIYVFDIAEIERSLRPVV